MIGHQFARVFIGNPENDVFAQAVPDAMYEPEARHEQVVP